jgi:hypothetical protein
MEEAPMLTDAVHELFQNEHISQNQRDLAEGSVNSFVPQVTFMEVRSGFAAVGPLLNRRGDARRQPMTGEHWREGADLLRLFFAFGIPSVQNQTATGPLTDPDLP